MELILNHKNVGKKMIKQVILRKQYMYDKFVMLDNNRQYLKTHLILK